MSCHFKYFYLRFFFQCTPFLAGTCWLGFHGDWRKFVLLLLFIFNFFIFIISHGLACMCCISFLLSSVCCNFRFRTTVSWRWKLRSMKPSLENASKNEVILLITCKADLTTFVCRDSMASPPRSCRQYASACALTWRGSDAELSVSGVGDGGREVGDSTRVSVTVVFVSIYIHASGENKQLVIITPGRGLCLTSF